MCEPKITVRHLNGSSLKHVEYEHDVSVTIDDFLRFVRKDLKARKWDGRIVSWMTFGHPDNRSQFMTQIVVEF